MEAYQIFDLIQSCTYRTGGLDVQYQIIPDRIEHKLYVLFQGSKSLLDWIIDFIFPAKVYKQQENVLWVHRGFVKAWQSVEDDFLQYFFEMTRKYKGYKVVVSGHSYGGAMAQLCAEDLNFIYGVEAELITFGSPKICWGKKTSDTIKKSCVSVENYANRNDIVTKVVPFYKTENEILLDENRGFFALFHPEKYHLSYGDPLLYI